MNPPTMPRVIDAAFQEAGHLAPPAAASCGPAAHTIGLQQFRSTVGETRRPLPYAEGWFLGCFSSELARGQVLTVPFMGQELVLYRTHAGLARVVEPYCPHLGAHLGHGGKVDGENLVCPLHGLAYGPDGGCVRTGHGERPPRAALTARHAREIDGAVLVWVDHAGRPPQWDVSHHDLGDFSSACYIRKTLDGYAHDAVENGADMVHFGWLHGLSDMTMSHRADDCRFEISLSARWKGLHIRGEFMNYGVGYVMGSFEMPDLGVRLQTQVFFTQIAPLKWKLAIADRLRIVRLGRAPRMLRSAIYAVLTPIASRWMRWFIEPDFPIWNAKSFIKHPRLTAGDKTLIVHRRWASQFYPGGLVDDPGALQHAGDHHAP